MQTLSLIVPLTFFFLRYYVVITRQFKAQKPKFEVGARTTLNFKKKAADAPTNGAANKDAIKAIWSQAGDADLVDENSLLESTPAFVPQDSAGMFCQRAKQAQRGGPEV
jgi:hypothetical protein